MFSCPKGVPDFELLVSITPLVIFAVLAMACAIVRHSPDASLLTVPRLKGLLLFAGGYGLLMCATPGMALADYALWVAPSAMKVLKDAAPPTKGKPRAELTAARAEWESFHLVLRANDSPVHQLHICMSDLRHINGTWHIPSACIAIQREVYVPLPLPEKTVLYPDGMAPNQPFDLAAHDVQPVFITVKVPRQCPAGRYTGMVTVTADGCPTRTVPVTLQVLGFTLPVTPSCTTAFGISKSGLAHYYRNASETERKQLYKQYYDFLLDYKISAYDLPYDVMSPEAKPYLEDPRMTSYVIPYSDDDTTLRKLVDYLIEHDYFRKGFFYPVDEPFSRESYDKLLAAAERLRTIEPRYRLGVPYGRGPEFDDENRKTIYDWMTGKITDWIIVADYLDKDPANRPMLQRRKQAGDAAWLYVVWSPGMPYNNLLVDMPGSAHRLLLWQQRREHMSGLLYWCTTYWGMVDDPWKCIQTVQDLSMTTFGDGSLLYPGETVGTTGPRSSLRLELLRDGIEDFDYFTIADAVLGPAQTDTYIGKLCRTLTDWDSDPYQVDRVHRELGLAIEAAVQQR